MADVSSNAQTAKYSNGLTMKEESVSKLQMAERKRFQLRPSPNGTKSEVPAHPKKVLHRQDTPLRLDVPIFKESSRFEKTSVVEEEEEEN